MIATLPRPSSSWRKLMFAKLGERDGLCCALCAVEHRFIYRAAGVSMSDDWEYPEDEPWLASKFTAANRSSNLEVDHRVPLHLGGFNRIENLWLLCCDCHKNKTAAENSVRLKGLGAGRNA